MARGWLEPLAGATGPFYICFLQLRPAPASSGQHRPAPAKLWILIERFKINEFLLDFFMNFCDAADVSMNSLALVLVTL